MNWTKWGHLIGINCLIGIALVLTIELVFGLFFPYAKGRVILCNYVLCSRNLVYETTFAGTIEYKRDEFGFRGRMKPVSDIDFLVIGGSTTDQRYVSDASTWGNVLENRLNEPNYNLDIVNAGVDGQSTFGHLWNFDNWLPLVPDLNVDYLVFYIGINETLPRVNNDVFDNKFVSSENGLKDWLKLRIKKSISYWGYTMVKFSFLTSKARVGHSSDRLNHFSESQEVALDVDTYRKAYIETQLRERLRLLVDEALKADMTPIFIMQKSARWVSRGETPVGFYGHESAEIEMISYKDTAFSFTNADFYHMERLVSEEVMRACDEYDLACFNGFEEFQFDRTNTYDLVHTNATGSREIATKLAPFLEKLIACRQQGAGC